MTPAASYETKTIRELYVIAKNAKIQGWHDMRKRQLVVALADWEKNDDSANVEAVLQAAELQNFATKHSASAKASKKKNDDSASSLNPNNDRSPSGVGSNVFSSESDRLFNGQNDRSGDSKKQSARSSSQTQRRSPADSSRIASSDERRDVSTSAQVPSGRSDENNENFSSVRDLKQRLILHKTLGSPANSGRKAQDQLLLMVRDPFWLHAYWEISSQLVERIRAAMGPLWHTADPVLRLYKVYSDSVGNIRHDYLSDIRIHGGVNNWYIDVTDPPSSFMVEIGYLTRDNQFFNLITSNIVETPQCYVHDAFGHPDVSWMGIPADFRSGFFAGTQQQFGGFVLTQEAPKESFGFSSSPVSISPLQEVKRNFDLRVDAELVIRGRTEPGVQLNIKGESVRLKDDGSFSIRYRLPERRHVFPIVAISPDGVETQTVILAVERNTKVLETVLKDDEDGD